MTGLRKLLLYSHDTYGLGHLRRNLAVATHLLATTAGLQVVLLSGSTVNSYFPQPPGLSVVPLPAVRKVGAEQYRPLDAGVSFDVVRRARTAVMMDVALRFRPDVFLVDHAPIGMGGELLGVFDALRLRSPDTRVVLGLRDVLDDPATVRQTWQEQGIYARLEEIYDEVVVYGCRQMFDVGEEYAVPAEVRTRLQYSGYIGRPNATVTAEVQQHPGEPVVLATAGGGGDGVAVLSAAISAARGLGLGAQVVTGPLMSEADRRRLHAVAGCDPGTRIVEFVASLRQAAEAACAVVTMGGYNSLCELTSTTTPVIVVPRVHPRTEQAIRAKMFADRGLVDVVLPGENLAARLATTLKTARAAAPRRCQPLQLDGLHRLAALLADTRRRAAAGQSACGFLT